MAPILLSAQPASFNRPQVLTEAEGLPQGFVSDIIQDQKGFIWMATRDGLCRYDGQRFKVFQPTTETKTSLSFPDVLYLKPDHRGRIWIRNTYKELDLFDPVRETFQNFSRQPYYKRAFSRDSLRQFCPDRRNRLWLYFRYKGLLSIDLTTNRIQYYPIRVRIIVRLMGVL
ncbi:two-component regulator propeller domain-containing protein [Spirosoma telluris]|uniref:ligand-binding sensor domain-containing protein n=1 Tax=Spirosoma telluris TaxID=2183553 RepID=UPI001313DC11